MRSWSTVQATIGLQKRLLARHSLVKVVTFGGIPPAS